MRIGMILDSSFPPDPRVENEALSLIQAGHNVYLFSLDFKRQSGIENYKGIHVVRYSAGNFLYKLSALAYTLPFYKWQVSSRISHFIKAYNVEVLHVHDMVIAEAAFSANKTFKLPLVLDFHENRPEIMKHYKHVNSIAGKLSINLKKWSAKYYELAARANRVVVVTEPAKQDIITKVKRDPNSIIVVSNSVRHEEFLNSPIQPDIADRMRNFFNLIYIGDTSLRRGTDTALQAVAIIKEKIPAVKLWLIGTSSANEDLKKLAVRMNLSRYVEFEGWKNPISFRSYLQNAHVALSPLKRNLHHDTTYANKLFQYMVCGKPLVVSDCTAQANLVSEEHCGLVHKADDPADLAAKILYLYENKNEAIGMGESGKSAVLGRWNWDLTVRSLLQMYEAGIN
jgi:glycosyltransferase involved in cell wall biosynthesis